MTALHLGRPLVAREGDTVSVFRRHHPDPPTRAPRDVERTAENVAAQVSDATDQLEAAFRRLQPVLDNVPAVINSHRPTPGGRP